MVELSYRTPLYDFIRLLREAAALDNRTVENNDYQRWLLSHARDRLILLAAQVDPRPWRTFRERLRDAWDVFRGRAAAVHIRATVYDDDWQATVSRLSRKDTDNG